MKNSEKIGIAIIIVLIIILLFSISVGVGQKNNPETIKINCETACKKIGPDRWFFPGVSSKDAFSTEEDCISACETRFKK